MTTTAPIREAKLAEDPSAIDPSGVWRIADTEGPVTTRVITAGAGG